MVRIIGKHGIWPDRHIQLSIPLQSHDIDIELLSYVYLSDGLSHPVLRHFNLKNSVSVTELHIVKYML